MISDLLGTSNLIKVEFDEEHNSFRPMFRYYYNEKYANQYLKIQTQDEEGNSIIKYYDLIKGVFVEFADE